MKYGTYTNTRNSAWQCLIDCNISELPIKPVKIAKLYNLQCKKADNKVLHGDAGKIKYTSKATLHYHARIRSFCTRTFGQ